MKLPDDIRQAIADLTGPVGLPGWCDTKKATHLAELVVEHRAQLIVELGVFGGRSFIPLALAASTEPTALAVGIDPWTVSAAIEGMDPHDADDEKSIAYWRGVPFDSIRRRVSDELEARKLWRSAAICQARSEIVTDLFSSITPAIDFLHIDGNHTVTASCRDVALWIPRVRRGGTIVFDDSNWPSVQTALKALDRDAELVDDYATGTCTYRVYRNR